VTSRHLGFASLTDDDGVCVVASARALQRRWGATAEFNYAFPAALLEGVRANELLAWFTGAEGEHGIALVLDSQPTAAIDASPPLALRVEEDDALVAMSYSQYTMACHYQAGVADERFSSSTAVPAGTYVAIVERLSTVNEVNGSFRVVLSRAANDALPPVHNASLREIPGWPE
jgi:hypothetical protein